MARKQTGARAKGPMDLEQSIFRAANAGTAWRIRTTTHNLTGIVAWLATVGCVGYMTIIVAGAIANSRYDWIYEYCAAPFAILAVSWALRLATIAFVPDNREY